eukprot:15365511-Ditylum_brightwellii.AAC.2
MGERSKEGVQLSPFKIMNQEYPHCHAMAPMLTGKHTTLHCTESPAMVTCSAIVFVKEMI